MRIPIGFIYSVLGAAVLSYLAIVTLIVLPSEGLPRWFAVGGIAGLSLIVGVLVNGISMQDFRKVTSDLKETSNLYSTLTSRLNPLLYSGIEDALHRRKTTYNSGGDLNFVVTAPIIGFYRVVGTTYPAEHPTRQNNTKYGEGVRGYFAERKVAGYARPGRFDQPKEGKRTVFDRGGQVLGEVTLRREAITWNTPVGVKWMYYRPIFEKSVANPWSDRVVGIINVHSLADDADRLFKTEEFQHQVDSIAAELSPYLDAIQVLVGEQKL